MHLTLVVARTTLTELGRRRGALALVLLLPLAFFLVRLDTHWTALRLLAMGLGWAVSTLALFTHISGRNLDRRLVVNGASPVSLHLGRQLAVLGLGFVVGAVYVALVAVTIREDLHDFPSVALMLGVTVMVSAPLGALVAAIVPRDLEGALLLLAVMAVQVLVDPADRWTRALPLWSTRELATYAVEPVGLDHVGRGLLHGGLTFAALTALGVVIGVTRLRTRRVAQIGQAAVSG